LEQEKKKYKDNIAKLDEAMETKLKPVKKEQREHEQELDLIKKRQKELNEKSVGP
jgi:chromosome segregation ATPase